MFRRRHPDLDDVTAGGELVLLRRIAAEAVILQDEAEALLRDVRAREPLAQLRREAGGWPAASSRSGRRCRPPMTLRSSATGRGCARSWTTTH